MLVHKQLPYTVPHETEDGEIVLYIDSDGSVMCADCCNDLQLVPYDTIIVSDDTEYDYTCSYCDEVTSPYYQIGFY